jgi:hypothetical protein
MPYFALPFFSSSIWVLNSGSPTCNRASCFYPGQVDHNPLIYASHVTGITEHTTTPIGDGSWDGISLAFFWSWPETITLLISTSQVTGITGVSYCIQLLIS